MIASGVYTPIREANCRYLIPLTYDDPFTIRTTLRELTRSKMTFDYEIINSATKKVAAKGYTIHSFANSEFKPTRLPPAFAEALGAFLGDKK